MGKLPNRIEALESLDTYIESRDAEYRGSEIAKTIQSVIAKARAQNRGVVMPRKDQLPLQEITDECDSESQ